jgi:hypothetical protein
VGVRPDQVKTLADKHGVDAQALAAAVNEHFAERAEERKRHREERLASRAPATTSGRYSAIRQKTYTPKRRPRSSGEDRQYVAGALLHWRTVHKLTQRQAQVRIGLKMTSQTWHMYESNVSCPPYRTLLMIIAATGLGHIADDGHRSAGDELDALAADTRARLEALRLERAERREQRTAAAIRR